MHYWRVCCGASTNPWACRLSRDGCAVHSQQPKPIISIHKILKLKILRHYATTPPLVVFAICASSNNPPSRNGTGVSACRKRTAAWLYEPIVQSPELPLLNNFFATKPDFTAYVILILQTIPLWECLNTLHTNSSQRLHRALKSPSAIFVFTPCWKPRDK